VNNLKHLKGTLKSLLEAINGIEGLHADPNEFLHEYPRTTLYHFISHIGCRKEFRTNKAVAKFDAVFEEAAWDDQGLRWGDDGLLYIVEFTNPEKTEWELV
jgi:hypothetical protein